MSDIHTDHRLSWVEIRWESTSGLFQKIQRPLARQLQCDNPKAVVISLEISVQTPMTRQDIETYESIDKCITKYMLRAEKKCRKLYMGDVPFSPELVVHLNFIKFWRIHIQRRMAVTRIYAQLCVYRAVAGSLGDRWSSTCSICYPNTNRSYLTTVHFVNLLLRPEQHFKIVTLKS